MPYETGSSTSAGNLQTALTAFATVNGWTNNGGILSKGQNHIRLTAPDDEHLEIEGDTDGTFTGGACGQKAQIYVPLSLWPVTHRFFSWTSPDFLGCVIQYDVVRVQMLWAGDINKAGSWVGGNWFGASHSELSDQTGEFYLDGDTAGGNFGNNANLAPGAPFWGTRNFDTFFGGVRLYRSSFLHAEVDGQVWPGSVTDDAWPSFPLLAHPVHRRQPNLWNSEVALLPLWLFFPRADTFHSPLGHPERIRTLKIDNYNTGDIITLGPDRWMVFPWHKKDITQPDGGTNPQGDYNHTGTFGAAIQYDGP